ncbi:MAG: MATE family efflux transporter [Eubacteriales bacterium]|nr:MATE family efflux transporter [Eubacteriales bacterium]
MDEKERKQYEKLALTPVNRLIPALAVPTVISMMITMIYNLVDAFFVGKLGTSASAAIGILMSIQAVFQAVGFMFGHGSGSNISIRLGKGDHKAAERLASKAFFGALGVSTLLAVLGLLFLTPLLTALGSTVTILPYARSYGIYILISGPALATGCVMNNIMRYEGKATFAMIGLVSGGVLNMIGDPIFMFGFGMGIHGAGLSTALSQYISFGILLYMFVSGKTISRFTLKGLQGDPKEFAKILRNGMPSLIRQTLNALASAVLNICAHPYGDAAIAAMAIVGRLAMFIGSAMVGIGQGFQPVASYNYGARKYRRIRQGLWFTWGMGELILGILAVIGFLFPEPIVRLFRDDPLVLEVGVPALRFQCIAVFFQPLSVVMNMTYQSMTRSKVASFLATLRSGLYFIPILLILPRFLGVTGIESAVLFSDALSFVTCVPFLLRFLKELPDRNERTLLDERYEETIANSET